MRRAILILVVLLLIALRAPSAAASGGDNLFEISSPTVSSMPKSSQPPAQRGLFKQGDWTFRLYQSGTLGEWSQGSAISTHVGVGYYFHDKMAIDVDAFGGWVHNNGTSDYGGAGGFDLLFHADFVSTPDVSLYFDMGAGAQESSVQFPNDSQFNFRLLTGLGLTAKITPKVRLLAGVHFIHISDAGLTPRNNGLNAAQPYLGVVIPF